MPHVSLLEWQTRGPVNCALLSGLRLSLDQRSAALVRSLAESGRLELLQLPEGVELRATSWVGQLLIGDLSISISPKITGMELITLLRYAYSLRNLRILSEVDYRAADLRFADILVAQLAEEASELIARGLHRDYRRFVDSLECPKGRIDFTRLAFLDASASSGLPCTYFDRSEAVPINEILLAGLQLAWRVASDPALRVTVGGLAQIMELSMPPKRLTPASIMAAQRALDRRTSSYASALTLIELLHAACGFDIGEPTKWARLPGFLFDMNAFFQNLLSRFFREQADGFRVEDQHRIRGMFTSDPAHPLKRGTPVLRPDFAVFVGDTLVELLDAKYRDLWSFPLPPGMLYQLAIYALSNPANSRAVILYPTLTEEATDQVVHIREPIRGKSRGMVVLRPVNLTRLADLTKESAGHDLDLERRTYARSLALPELALGVPHVDRAPASKILRRI